MTVLEELANSRSRRRLTASVDGRDPSNLVLVVLVDVFVTAVKPALLRNIFEADRGENVAASTGLL